MHGIRSGLAGSYGWGKPPALAGDRVPARTARHWQAPTRSSLATAPAARRQQAAPASPRRASCAARHYRGGRLGHDSQYGHHGTARRLTGARSAVRVSRVRVSTRAAQVSCPHRPAPAAASSQSSHRNSSAYRSWSVFGSSRAAIASSRAARGATRDWTRCVGSLACSPGSWPISAMMVASARARERSLATVPAMVRLTPGLGQGSVEVGGKVAVAGEMVGEGGGLSTAVKADDAHDAAVLGEFTGEHRGDSGGVGAGPGVGVRSGEGVSEAISAGAGVDDGVNEFLAASGGVSGGVNADPTDNAVSAHTVPPAGRAARRRLTVEVVAWARAIRARSAPSSVSSQAPPGSLWPTSGSPPVRCAGAQLYSHLSSIVASGRSPPGKVRDRCWTV